MGDGARRDSAVSHEAATADRARFRMEAAAMGIPTVDLDRALQLAGELEDDELIRRMLSGE